MTIAGRRALVTGGASGLGEACVRALVGEQARVLIADLNEDKGQGLARELGTGARFRRMDVCEEADVLAAIEESGGLDLVIHCAGIATAERALGKDGPLPLERFEKVLRVNVNGTFNVVRLAAAAMAKNEAGPDGERGVIVMTSSVAAFDGQIGQAAYSASKGAVAAMTLPLARELARVGVRVLAIAPGLFRTPLLAGLPEEAMKKLAETVPFPARLGEPAEFAGLALHMVRNRMLNGEVVRLDGALRMAPR